MNEIAMTGSERGYTPPQWLISHRGKEANVTKETVQDELAKARRSLQVAGQEVLLISLREALSIFELPEHWDVQAKPYLKALDDLPPDLLAEALDHVVRTYEYKFPKPASIRKPVEKELSDRAGAVQRFENMLAFCQWPKPPRPPPTQAMKDAVEAIMDQHRAWAKGQGMTV